MPCQHCKAGKTPCDLARDRILLLDDSAQVVFFAPSTNGLGNIVGKHVYELVQPEDRDYVLERFRRTTKREKSVCWLIRDVWDARTWLTHVESARGISVDRKFAVATSRPVCQMVFNLSRRQREILRGLLRSSNTHVVAALLGIHETTVRSHLARAALATQCPDLSELMRWANDMQHALAIDDEIDAYLSRRQG